MRGPFFNGFWISLLMLAGIGSPLAGANAPLNETSYVPGSLIVNLLPLEAAEAGAAWRLAGDTGWRADGEEAEDLAPGEHGLEFDTPPLWVAPAGEAASATVTAGQQTVKYAVFKPVNNRLRVTLAPAGVVDAGAAWRVAGSNQWLTSGAEAGPLPLGEVSVEFKAVAGWEAPAPISVTMVDELTLEEQAEYTGVIEFRTKVEKQSLEPGELLTVNWKADIQKAGTVYYIELAPEEGGASIPVTNYLWDPIELTREITVNIPSDIPRGYYRLRVVSLWLEQHPEDRPQGTWYGESASAVLIAPRTAAAPAWTTYN